MPNVKSYGLKKANNLGIKKTKSWGQSLKGSPRPKPIKLKGGK